MAPTSDDGDLLRAWHAHRDQAAFRAVCDRHVALVAAACRWHAAPDADEAVQAVFLVLARRAGSVDGANLAGWLTLTARRVVANQHRVAARRRRHEQEAAVEHARLRDAVATEPAWEDARRHLDAALASLSAGRREAVLRFYLEGKPQAEVAAELGCSADAVKTRVSEGLASLRAFFARRGVALGAVAIASGLAAEGQAAESTLAATCAQTVFAPARAPGAAAIAAGVTAVSLGKVAAFAVLAALVATASGVAVWQARAARPVPIDTTALPTVVADAASRLLFSESFADDAFAARGWYDNAGFSLSASEHAPGSRQAAEFRFLPGSQAPIAGGTNRHLFPPAEAIQLSYAIKYGPGWVSAEGYLLQFLVLTTADDAWAAPSSTHLTCAMGVNRGIPFVKLHDARNIAADRVGQDLTALTEARAIAGGNGDSDGHGPGVCFQLADGAWWNEKIHPVRAATLSDLPGPYGAGQWHQVEVQLRLNRIVAGKAVPDGVIRYRVDGRLVLDLPRVMFRTAQHADLRFNQLVIAPWSSESSRPQTFWIDAVTLTADP